eukprot:5851510-Amphidinium_carterae.1
MFLALNLIIRGCGANNSNQTARTVKNKRLTEGDIQQSRFSYVVWAHAEGMQRLTFWPKPRASFPSPKNRECHKLRECRFRLPCILLRRWKVAVASATKGWP